jgi:EAL domain-containing protein (putative c-di-GMP-specific phosphodiesterase class I)
MSVAHSTTTGERTDPTSVWSRGHVRRGPAIPILINALLLALSWTMALRVGSDGGGTHWFFVPILYSAMTLGSLGASATACLSALLAGPFVPADVATAAAQDPVAWLTRAALFLAVGLGGAIWIHRRREIRRRLRPVEEVARRRRAEASEILAIIHEDRLAVYFQPIVELDTGRVTGMESLARFPRESEQQPERWFRRAWASGVGPDLEIAAVRKAVTMGWVLPHHAYQAVNLSPEVLISARFEELLDSLPWTRMVVEITEHLEIDDYQRLAGPISEIRSRGGRLAIDDVGAGFASLRHVLSLAPDIIKLDGSLSHGLEFNLPRAAVARGLVACAEELGATVVAEGVETADDARGLRRVGAHCAQGFLFGRPAALHRPGVVRLPDIGPAFLRPRSAPA